MNESDLRVKRTKRLLQEAFVRLVTENNYEAITIRDITTEAQVGYQTFYRHYKNKEDLLYAMLQEVLMEFQPMVALPNSLATHEENTRLAFRFVERYATLVRFFLKSPVVNNPTHPIMNFAIAEGARSFEGVVTRIPLELVATYFANSFKTLAEWWLFKGVDCTAEEMAEYFNQLVVRPLWRLHDQNK